MFNLHLYYFRAVLLLHKDLSLNWYFFYGGRNVNLSVFTQ